MLKIYKVCLGCKKPKTRDKFYSQIKNNRRYYFRYCKECSSKRKRKPQVVPNEEIRKELCKFVHIKLISRKFSIVDMSMVITFWDELFPYKLASSSNIMKCYTRAWKDLHDFYIINKDIYRGNI